MKFSKITMVPGQRELAKVNRKTGALYLSSGLWNQLPTDQKEFVLFHEQGHLQLQTSDEFRANRYAVGKFAPARTFDNRELGKRIIVMTEILTKGEKQVNAFTGEIKNTGSTTDIYGIGAGLSAIFQGLPILGVGSKIRQEEAAANAAANVQVLTAQSQFSAAKGKTTIKGLIVAGILILVSLIIYFSIRKK